MRLWLLLGLAVVLLASAVTEAHPDLKVTTVGLVEAPMGLKNYVYGLEVVNPASDHRALTVLPDDFQAIDPWGNTYEVHGQALNLSCGATGAMSLQTSCKISPDRLVYGPENLTLKLRRM